jgi:hypothetical protein
MGDCNTCPLYQAAEKFALTSCLRSPDREYSTEHGRLIAAACSRLGLRLTDVSTSCGYSPDYLARVCRGSLPLVHSAAVRFGTALGIDLGEYSVVGGRRSLAPKDTQPAPDLPGVSIPVAPGLDLVMGDKQGAAS